MQILRKKKLFALNSLYRYQDGRVVKALDLRSNGRVVRVGSNPTPGNFFLLFVLTNLYHFTTLLLVFT